jgi:hypothetical protein
VIAKAFGFAICRESSIHFTLSSLRIILTLTLLTWKIRWAPNNASKWQMGFNSAFKGLKCSGLSNWSFPPWMCFFGYSWVYNAHLFQDHSGGWGCNDFRMHNFNVEQQSLHWSVCLQFQQILSLQLGTSSLYFRNSHQSTHGFLSRP